MPLQYIITFLNRWLWTVMHSCICDFTLIPLKIPCKEGKFSPNILLVFYIVIDNFSVRHKRLLQSTSPSMPMTTTTVTKLWLRSLIFRLANWTAKKPEIPFETKPPRCHLSVDWEARPLLHLWLVGETRPQRHLWLEDGMRPQRHLWLEGGTRCWGAWGSTPPSGWLTISWLCPGLYWRNTFEYA